MNYTQAEAKRQWKPRQNPFSKFSSGPKPAFIEITPLDMINVKQWQFELEYSWAS